MFRRVRLVATALFIAALAPAQDDLRQGDTEFSADLADLNRRYDVPMSAEDSHGAVNASL